MSTGPELTNREQHRRKIGALAVARNVHLSVLGVIHRKPALIIEDAQSLCELLSRWKDDHTAFGKASKAVIEAAVAEAASWHKSRAVSNG